MLEHVYFKLLFPTFMHVNVKQVIVKDLNDSK